MDGQMTIFDFLNTPKPGDWLDDGSWTMGPPLHGGVHYRAVL